MLRVLVITDQQTSNSPSERQGTWTLGHAEVGCHCIILCVSSSRTNKIKSLACNLELSLDVGGRTHSVIPMSQVGVFLSYLLLFLLFVSLSAWFSLYIFFLKFKIFTINGLYVTPELCILFYRVILNFLGVQ